MRLCLLNTDSREPKAVSKGRLSARETKGEKKNLGTLFFPVDERERTVRRINCWKKRGKKKREVFNRSHVESIGKPVVDGGGGAKVAPRRRREIRLQMA